MTRPRLLCSVALTVLLTALPSASAVAQNREHLQMQADLRMLQEQVGQLQLAVNQMTEWATGTDARLDALEASVVKRFADQALVVDQIVATLATMREKLDDNTTRVAQLTQESSAIREGLRMLTNQINALVLILRPPPDPEDADGGDAPADDGADASGGTPPFGPVTVPPSPATYMDDALNHYYSGRYELAIEAFREVIELFPESPQAAAAQFNLGEAYFARKQWALALPEYRRLTEQHPESTHAAEAYLLQGLCLRELRREAEARTMFEEVIRRFPGTPFANQAEQLLR